MELGYPDNYSEDMVNLQEDDGSTYDGNIDLNLAVNKEEREVHGAENEAWDKTQVELDEQAQHGSPSLLADLEHERLKSPNERLDSQVYSKLDHEEEKLKEFDFGQEKSYSYLGETEMGSGKFEEGLYNEFKGGEKHPSEMDSMGQQSNMMEDNSPHHEEHDDSRRISGNLQNEKMESVADVMERGGTELQMGKTYDGIGTEEGDINYSGKSPSVYEKVAGSSDAHPTGSRGRSSSPLREMSRSPERALEIQGDADRKQPLSPHGHDFPYSSPRMSRQKFPPSPQRNGGHGKRDIPEDHPSLYARRTSDSPARRSRRDSPRRDNSVLKSTSPRRRHLSPDRRRDERSVSRSPPRRRDLSSGYRRDYRDRSRSRSPNAADRYRRSPRRYSPRRRSPSGYHSRRRSPRRRPWSPPRNRNNGIGRPGNNLFVAGFSFVTTERDLERKFSRFGRVKDVRIVRDKWSGDSRGFGFLSLERDEDADAAIRALDQTEWNGRVVLVEKSKTR